MVRLPRVRLALVVLALLAAVGLVCASASGGRDRADAGVGKLRPRTLVVLPGGRVVGLLVDGRRVAWWIRARERPGCELQIQILNPATHRLATLRPDLNCEVPSIVGTALAGTRVVYGVGSSSGRYEYGYVRTMAVGDRRTRNLTDELASEDGTLESSFGYPVRVAGGGGTLAFLTLRGNYQGQLSTELWRVLGRKAVRVPYQPAPLAALAVEGRLLATSNWVVADGRNGSPAFSPDGREIAWTHDSTLWVMRSDGSSQRPLSSAGAAKLSIGSDWYPSSPRWSPDSTTLAFESGTTIALIDRDGSNQRRLVEGGSPAWSPDGTRLAFVRGGDLWLIGADGSNQRRLVEGGSPAWSPDGTRLAFGRGGDLYVVDVATGAERDLTPGERVEQSPAWSPDGTRITFARTSVWTPDWRPETRGSIYTIQPDGSDLREISGGKTYEADHLPAWSPDGKQIAYQTDPSDSYLEIRVVNADGSDQRTLQKWDSIGIPAWSPDGSVVVAGDTDINEGGTHGILALHPTGGQATRLAAPTNPPAVELRNIRNGKLLRTWNIDASALWLSDRYLITRRARTCQRYSLASGKKLGTNSCRNWANLTLSSSRAAYRIGRRIYQLDLKSGHSTLLTVTGPGPVGPVLEQDRLVWAENYRKGSRIREIVLP